MAGNSFDLNLKYAKRFLGKVDTYFEHLISIGKMKGIANPDKAIKEKCGGKKLKLVSDILFSGTETYTAIYQGGKEARLDVADYWIVILHTTLFDDDWT